MRLFHRLLWLAPALLLVAALFFSVGLLTKAHAASTITVSTCDATSLDSALATAQASSGNTIAFSCSGDIVLDQTLTITTTLTMTGSGQAVTLDGNHALQVVHVNSGANLTLTDLTIANGVGNTNNPDASSEGGGIYNAGGTVSLSSSTLSGNTGSSDGGGIYNNGGMVNVTNSTLSGNSASIGGGIFSNLGTVNVTNSTLSGNSTSSSGGGGIYNDDGMVSVTNSTLSGNSTSGGFGGGIFNNGGTVTSQSSIIAENIASTGDEDCANIGGTFTDNGYNLEVGTSCRFTSSTSKQKTNPKLASALANNGGPTQTLALLDGSPAINAIPAASCPTTTDQRGITRPQGPGCDIGAFEYRVPTISVPSTITTPATSAAGAAVTFTVTGTEPDDASATPTISCTPASGSTFPVGATTVNCSASDAATPPDVTTGSFQVVVQDVTPPILQVPSTITVNASSPSGASVTYSVTATSTTFPSSQLTISCSPASGSTFPIGTTTVNCSVTDPLSNKTTGSFQVIVKDVAPPTLQLLSTITVNASSPSGASVTYSVTATSTTFPSSQLTISCSPASGGTFAIGTTTVSCSVTDPLGNKTTGSFQVVVLGASAQVNNLITTVNSFHLAQGMQNSLDSQLQTVLADLQANNPAQANSDLQGFINHVKAQAGKHLTRQQAQQLLNAAATIRATLGY